MTYSNVVPGLFLDRPNRFIAHVEIDGCHVKNTGRCRELLVPGTRVYLQVADNPARKTKYDLIAVEKGDLLINMDSQAPNRVAADYLPRLFPDLTLLRPETVHGDSRFDFYLETPAAPWFVEVKGVTLEENGTALFPVAPTQRGIRRCPFPCRSGRCPSPRSGLSGHAGQSGRRCPDSGHPNLNKKSGA